MKKLFLDDFRTPYDVFKNTIDSDYEFENTWDIVKTFDDFIDIINLKGPYDLISLDHDLSTDHYKIENQKGKIEYSKLAEKTGYHACEWLINYCIKNKLKFPNYKVHSQNPQGKKNIIELIENAKRQFSI